MHSEPPSPAPQDSFFAGAHPGVPKPGGGFASTGLDSLLPGEELTPRPLQHTAARRLLSLMRADWVLFFFGYLLLNAIGVATLVINSVDHYAYCYSYWPAAGLYLAALILAPKSRWFYFVAAALVADLLTMRIMQEAPWSYGIVRMLATALEATAGAWMVRRFLAEPFDFRSIYRVIGFAFFSALLATAGYALLVEGTKPLWLGEGFSPRQWYFRWMGHSLGAVTIGATMISLATDLHWPLRTRRGTVLRSAAMLALAMAATFVGFGPTRWIGLEGAQFPLFVMPVLLCSAVFINRPATTLVAFCVSIAVIVITLKGVGPLYAAQAKEFGRQNSLQTYIFATTLWPLIVATVLEEKLFVSRHYSTQFEHLQQLLHSSADAIALKDAQGRYLLVNESAAKFMNTTVEAMVGKQVGNFLSPEIASQIERLEWLAKQGKISETVEEHWNDHGQKRVLIVSRSAWPRTGEGEKGLVVIAREVTEIRRQKQALAHSEQRFQALVDSIPTCIFEADQFGQCKYVNAIWTELSGQRVEQALDMGWVDAVHEQDRNEILMTWRDFSAGKISEFSREIRLRKPDSSVTWVQMHIGALRGEEGRVQGGIGAIIDITHRKYAVDNLRESEELFRTLANAAPVMIWRTDSKLKCSFLNDRWLDFLGIQMAEAELGGWNARIHPDDRVRRMTVVREALAKNASFELDYRVLRRDGEYRWIVDSGVPIFNDKRELTGFIGGCIDITDRQAARTALQQLNLELEMRVAQRTSALVTANQRLKEEVAVRQEIMERLDQKQSELAHISRVTALGEMAASLAHELKQPLYAIRNYVSGMKMLTRQGQTPPPIATGLAEIDRETHRAAAIIDRIRSFAARSNAEHAPLVLETVIQDSIALMHSETTRQGTRIRFSSEASEPVQVRGDWIQIQQVLVNLIQNAVDAMKGSSADEKEIELRLRMAGEGALIECRDRGSGIASEDLGKIFDPFYTRKATGLGMGLAISRSIIEAHFGRIMVLETGPQGTTMGIWLPLLVEEEPAADPLELAPEGVISAVGQQV